MCRFYTRTGIYNCSRLTLASKEVKSHTLQSSWLTVPTSQAKSTKQRNEHSVRCVKILYFSPEVLYDKYPHIISLLDYFERNKYI